MTNYTDAQRALQARFDTQRLATALEQSIVVTELEPAHIDFIQSRDFFFLSTVSAEGEPTVSHKGGGVGTVIVEDATTLLFPAYDGNGMFLSLGNIAATGHIGLLFMDFETPHRVRVQASATIEFDEALLDRFPGAIAVVRARVDRAFVNCARYIHKYERKTQSRHVPDATGAQPVASWKRIDGMQAHLADSEAAKANDAGLITGDEYARLLGAGDS